MLCRYRPDAIAQVAHEATRALATVQGDKALYIPPPWSEIPADERDETVDKVINTLASGATWQDNHDMWVHRREAAGWKRGHPADPVVRQHPALMPHSLLPSQQCDQETLFHAVVMALSAHSGGL
jgi:hypothetical protein